MNALRKTIKMWEVTMKAVRVIQCTIIHMDTYDLHLMRLE